MKTNEQPKVKFLLNGEQINSRGNNPREILSCILGSIPNVEFWSPEALKELLIGTLGMTADFAKEAAKEIGKNPETKKKATKLTRFTTWASSIIRDLSRRPIEEEAPLIEDGPSSWDRIAHSAVGITPKKLLRKVYELVLVGEGLSVIPGFHYSFMQHTSWKA